MSNGTPLSAAGFEVGLRWDKGAKENVDLDVQLVVVDTAGQIIDAVFYNNPRALNGAVVHSGDSLDGAVEGLDERITVNAKSIPPNVGLLVALVCAHSPVSLSTARGAMVTVGNTGSSTPAFSLDLTRVSARCSFVGVMQKTSSGWVFGPFPQPIEDRECQHFMDCIEPMQGLIRHYYPQAKDVGKLNFSMRKGTSVAFGAQQNALRVGLGWDTAKGKIDLDVSCVLLDGKRHLVDCAFYGNLVALGGAVKHSGDNLTGEGNGDDETISVNLAAIPPNVLHIFFVITIYTKGRRFTEVANPYCRVLDERVGQEVCHPP